MRQRIVPFLVGCVISLSLVFTILFLSASELVPGATSYELIEDCELIHFGIRLQPTNTLALACPGMDMVRLWPLPIQKPWFEDWFISSDRMRGRITNQPVV